MPAETGYRPQVQPRGTAPMPLASAEDYGAGVGRGVQQLAGAIHRDQLTRFEIQENAAQDRELADVNARFAQVRADYDRAEIDARAEAGPGGAGHAEKMAELRAKAKSELLTGVGYQHVQDRVNAQFDAWNGDADSRAYGWEVVKRAGKTIDDSQTIIRAATNRVRTGLDPNAYQQESLQVDDHINGLKGIDAEKKDELRRWAHAELAIAHIERMQEINPAAALVMIQSGAFNDILTPEQLDAAINGTKVEIRRADSIAAHQANMQVAADTDALSAIKTELASGQTVDPARLDGLLARAQARGDQSAVASITVTQAQIGIKRETDVMTEAQVNNEINRLAGLEHPSAEEEMRLQALRQARPGIIDRNRNRPGEQAANNGNPPPAFDLGDRASVQAYATWRNSVMQQSGRDPGFPPDAVALWQQEAKGPAAKRVALANELQVMAPAMRIAAARAIDGNDRLFQHAVTLDTPRVRELALLGPDARRANPDIIKDVDARETFEAYVGTALNGLPPEFRGNVRETASNIYAAAMEQHGGKDFSEETYKRAIEASMQGRITTWNGAKVVVPPRLGADGFSMRLSRWTGQIPAGAANGKPVSSSGGEVTAGYIRNSLIPRMVGDGRYMFIDAAGQPLRNAQGQPWVVKVDALPMAKIERPHAAQQKAMPAVVDLPRPSGPQAVWRAQ